jgi:hypothetical protein
LELRKYQILIFAVLPGFIMGSCKKEDINIDITSNNWEVVKIKKQGESKYTKAGKSYIIVFKNDGVGCTEICSDSDFAVDLAYLFPKMTNYYGKGKELILGRRILYLYMRGPGYYHLLA